MVQEALEFPFEVNIGKIHADPLLNRLLEVDDKPRCLGQSLQNDS